MTTELGAPLLPSVTNWWKTAFDSDLYRAMAPLVRGKDYLEAELRLLPQWLQVEPGQMVLDVACGDGRVAIPMAAAGYKVAGLDLSTRLLAAARRRQPEAQGRLELAHVDMRTFELHRPVDAAYCLFVSFGVFLDEEDHLKTLKAIAAAVKPGGRFYLEVHNPFYFQAPTSHTERLDDGIIVYQTMLEHRTCRVNTQIHFARTNRPTQTVALSWRAFTLFEITRLLDAAGFDVVQTNGGVLQPGDFVPVKTNTLGIVAERRA